VAEFSIGFISRVVWLIARRILPLWLCVALVLVVFFSSIGRVLFHCYVGCQVKELWSTPLVVGRFFGVLAACLSPKAAFFLPDASPPLLAEFYLFCSCVWLWCCVGGIRRTLLFLTPWLTVLCMVEGRICEGKLPFPQQNTKTQNLYLYPSVDSWVSPYGRVRAWVIHITYRNVFFMLESKLILQLFKRGWR
jgi:hypothetical protein